MSKSRKKSRQSKIRRDWNRLYGEYRWTVQQIHDAYADSQIISDPELVEDNLEDEFIRYVESVCGPDFDEDGKAVYESPEHKRLYDYFM